MPSFHKRKPQPLAPGHALAYKLGERHYARSEQTWADAGKPAADVALRWDGRSLSIAVDVHVGGRPLTFAPADERNPYDNEHPDVNGDGIELFVRTAGQDAGWMLVPERGSNAVRVRSITGGSAEPAVVATWTATDDGYRVEASVPLGPVDDRHLALDVLVNEMPPGRERRRGQLALSGGRGRFVYLRGDRHDPAALLPFTLIDA